MNETLSPSTATVLTNDDYFNGKLYEIVNDLIQIYYSMAETCEHSYLFVNQLCNLLNLFNEKRFYQRLTDIVSESSAPVTESGNGSSQVINNVMRKWLSDNKVSVDAVLNVVFHLLVYLKDEEKVTILNNISEVSRRFDAQLSCIRLFLTGFAFLRRTI